MIKEAIILAGGFGTRLRKTVSEVPKPIAPVAGKPFLDYIFNYLSHYGVGKAILSIGFEGEKIRDRYGNSCKGIAIDYAEEPEPLGTGGGIRFAMEMAGPGPVLVLNGDTFFDVDLNALEKFHNEKSADASLVLRKMPSPDRYGTVSLDGNARVVEFAEKQTGLQEGLINGGTYLFQRDIFSKVKVGNAFSIEQDFFKPYVRALDIYGFVSTGYFIDIGVPEDYYRANEEFQHFRY